MGFHGTSESEIATLVIELSGRELDYVACQNAPAVRALEEAFGNVIGDGHTVRSDAGFLDKEIYYCDNGFILEWFSPVDTASEELKEAYNKQNCEWNRNQYLIQFLN